MLNVGLIGYGMAGRVFHAPLITALPQLTLTKVVERRGATARERYPWVEIVSDVNALWQDEALELVVIATPNTSHFELAQQALQAGKHVVVDKPFTVTSEQAQTLIELAQQQQRIISVFHNRRWDGDFLTVQKLLADGHLGQVVDYESHFDRFRSALKPNAWREAPEAGSGILYDLGAHLLDQAVVLFGWPRALTANVRQQRAGAQTDDAFSVVLHYDQLNVTLKASMLARIPGPRFALHGTHGSFIKYGLDPQEDSLKQGLSPTIANWGREPQTEWGRLNTEINGLHFDGQVETLPGNYLAYYQNVSDAISGQAALSVTPEAARDTIRLIEMARQSQVEGRTVAVPLFQ